MTLPMPPCFDCGKKLTRGNCTTVSNKTMKTKPEYDYRLSETDAKFFEKNQDTQEGTITLCNSCELQRLHKAEKKRFECGFSDEEELTCIYQYNMFRQGYVMDCEGNWLTPDEAKKYPRPDELQRYVDWIHVHSSEECSKYYKHVDPKDYEDTCKHFGVVP